MSGQCFIHVDLDAFYASVEQLDFPEYKGKPVIVGSLPTDRRGVVSTCSYEARAYGVHSAMPISMAVKKCPHGIFLRGRMKRYQEKSKEIMSIFSDFSPDVHQISVDEAFIDISGTERLFGSPEDVAKMLKARVLEQTGLTVSVGISTTKYIAKIASGMFKPSGLYVVKPGDEENFMLQLPLKDIWGIGQKTLSRINEAGFFTTKDVHKASQNMLINLFGESTGLFLYNAVRGLTHETFNETPKTRSISSERTFSFDLTDRYAIDTALMELSWDVMFRLFSEKWTSKTAHIKIRYEDFTTVSIQETSTRPISSADDLYTRVKKLFDKKYENGRGIRLVGIAAQNLEDKSLPMQQELFDENNQKKIAVEKTVIEMQKKNPGIQIQKARLLKSSLVFLTSLFFMLTSLQKGFTQDIQSIELAKPFEDAFISGEAPIAIFNLTPDSPEVEFFAEGTWEAMLTNYISITSSEETNNAPSLTFNPPVFIQKTDLSVWFLLQDTWYFEANVADDYDKSTIAAGYYGQGYLKHARVGNRYITFPQDYGVSEADNGIGSGSNQGLGIMGEWEGSDWSLDAMVRYDMTESMEKTWVGQYEATDNILQLSDWEKGARFILPDNASEYIENVYIASEEQNETLYKDTYGIEYKVLSSSEYLIIPGKNMLVLSTPTDKNIVVTFTSSLPDIGAFDPQSGYLGEVQSWFGTEIALEDYTPESFFTKINNKDALILQTENFFSPFTDASLYSISSFSQTNNATVLSLSTGVSDKTFGTLILDSTSLEVPGFTANNYFDTQSSFIQVYTKESSSTVQSKNQFPFANTNPFVYLSPSAGIQNTLNNSDNVLSIQSLTNSTVLDIGTDAISGSITVYRNGIKESLYRYDANTGLVSLTSPPGSFDTIRITWKQNTETATTGSVTLAAGYKKILSPNLDMNVSASLLWPVLENDAFIDSSFDAPASINSAFDLQYTKDSFSLENTTSAIFQNPNISDTYRIDGMDGFQSDITSLSSSAGVNDFEGLVPVLNQRPNGSAITQLDSANKGSTTTSTVRDGSSGEYIVRSSWDIEKSTGWISQTVDLGGNASILPTAETFLIQIKQNISAGSKIYLQLGVSDDDEALEEMPGEIPTWDIINGPDIKRAFQSETDGWQYISVYLKDEDRAKLTKNQNARIIIVSDNPVSGTLEIGSYEISGNSFTVSGDGLRAEEVRSIETGKTDPTEMQRFNQNSVNNVQYFKWDDTLSTETLNAIKFFKAIPFSTYTKMHFFAYVPETIENAASVKISLEGENDFGSTKVLELVLQENALKNLEGSWHEVTIDLLHNSVKIGNQTLNTGDYSLSSIDNSISPSKIILEFSGKGSIYLDEIYLTNAAWNFTTENKTAVNWEKQDVFVTDNDFPVFTNAKVATNIESAVSVPIESVESKNEVGLLSDTNASIDIIGVTTDVSVIFSASNSKTGSNNEDKNIFLESASHKILSTPVFPIFQIFSFMEDYRYIPQSNAAKKIEEFGLDFSELGLNIQTNFVSEAEQESTLYFQDVGFLTNASFGKNSFVYSLESNYNARESGYMDSILIGSYGTLWKDISAIQFSTGYDKATKRTIDYSLNQVFNFPEIELKPSFFISAQNVYSNTNDITNTATDTVRIIVPFSIGIHAFSTTFEKNSYVDSTREISKNYVSDVEYYFDRIKDKTWAYTTIPFYDFYDKDIIKEMQKSISEKNYNNVYGYTSEWLLGWNRRNSYSSVDLFIPSSAKLSVSRDIRTSITDVSDIIQLLGGVSFLSLNNFGRYGSYPIFDWYEQDEFIQSIEAAYKIDNLSQGNKRLEITGYNQFSIYFTNTNRITALSEGYIDTDSQWRISLDTIWERQGTSSIIVDGIHRFFPKFAENETVFDRENSLYFSLSGNRNDEENNISQSYGITHMIDIHVNDYASVGLDLGSELFIEKNYFNLLNTISLIGKLQF